MDPDMRGVRSYLEGKFLGTWACARHAVPHLKAGGSMTFLTGGAGARAKFGLAAVTPTFAAVKSLSQSLALELAPIRVNTIRPGFVDTDFWMSACGDRGGDPGQGPRQLPGQAARNTSRRRACRCLPHDQPVRHRHGAGGLRRRAVSRLDLLTLVLRKRCSVMSTLTRASSTV